MRTMQAATLVAALGLLAVLGWRQWDDVRTLAAQADLWLLGAAWALAVGLGIVATQGWRLCLRAVGVQVPLGTALYLWFVGSAARYVPGGVWSYASRAVLANRLGIPAAAAGSSMYFETLVIAASSLAVGLLALTRGQASLSLAQAALIWIAICALLHPKVLASARRIPGRAGAWFARIPLPSTRSVITLYAYYTAYWVAFGFAFCVLGAAFSPLVWDHALHVGATFALGYWLGFVVVLVPGGLGVREGAYYLLLLAALPAEASLTVALASRIWIMAAEITMLIAITATGLLRPRATPPPT
jgi:glycosyltransferase 2 family protein